jgi:hypothetical protein
MPGPDHAFIADSRLYARRGGTSQEIESDFARANLEDYERRKTSRGWKTAEAANGYSIWGQQAAAAAYTGFRFLTVVPAAAGSIYYLLTNGHVTGLFLYDLASGEERRLFHKNDFFTEGLDFSPARQELVCAVAEEDGAVNLNLYSEEGRYKNALTGGDSRDTHPAFSRAAAGQILYQSAGIARHEGGHIVAIGPESLNRLDLETGAVEEIAADDRYDFLQPREDRHGNIYCIRRPYRAHGSLHPLRPVANVLLFPFHFLGALVGFLKTFTRLFGEKPKRLGPDVELPERDKYVMVFGQAVNLAKIRRPKNAGEDPSLVPANYELVRISPQGETEVLARKVSGFDVSPDGTVHFTNGFRVQTREPGGTVFRHPVIESLRLMGA